MVDGNVSRVLARVTRLGGEVTSRQVTDQLWRTADSVVCAARPGEFNQAVMELGARVCSPRAPTCSSCPVSGHCAALTHTEPPDVEECDLCLPRHLHNPELGVANYPRKAKKAASRSQETVVVVLARGCRYLLERRPSSGLLANLLQFPSVELSPGQEVKEAEKTSLLRDHLKTHNVDCSSLVFVDSVLHVFSHINMTYSVYTAEASGGEDETEDEDSGNKSTWLTEEEFKSCGTSTAMRKVFKCITDAKKTSSKNTNKSKREKKTDKKQPNLLSFFKVKNE